MSFWSGFEKRAASMYGAMKGLKALNRGNQPSRHMTARPISLKATVGRTNTLPLPSASSSKATTMPKAPTPKSTQLKTPISNKIQNVNIQKSQGVPGVAI